MSQIRNKINRMPRPILSAALIAMIFSTNVQAAVLSDLQGPVSVNHGNGFRPSSKGSPLAPGDRVRTGDGFAVVQYDGGCSTRIGPRQVAMVYSTPPCYRGDAKAGAAAPAPVESSLDPVLIVGGLAAAATGSAIGTGGGDPLVEIAAP